MRNIAWFVPHQANYRIIDAIAKRIDIDQTKIMVNIQKYGNNSAWYYSYVFMGLGKKQLKKGDNIILAAFGAGFTWGTIYLKWAYDGANA